MSALLSHGKNISAESTPQDDLGTRRSESLFRESLNYPGTVHFSLFIYCTIRIFSTHLNCFSLAKVRNIGQCTIWPGLKILRLSEDFKLCTDVHNPDKTKTTDFGGSLTLLLAS